MLAENIFWCLNFLAKKTGKPFNKGSIVEVFFFFLEEAWYIEGIQLCFDIFQMKAYVIV